LEYRRYDSLDSSLWSGATKFEGVGRVFNLKKYTPTNLFPVLYMHDSLNSFGTRKPELRLQRRHQLTEHCGIWLKDSEIGNRLEIEVISYVTFYPQLRLEKQEKREVKLCTGKES
jgi:hypothetical protein